MSDSYIENCKLYKKDKYQWIEYINKCIIINSSVSFSIRDQETRSLVIDIPWTTIAKYDKPNDLILRVYPKEQVITNGGLIYGIVFDKLNDVNKFIQIIKKYSSDTFSELAISGLGSKVDEILPDVSDTITQEYIIRLLLNKDFKNLVDKVSDMLTSNKINI